MLQDKGTEAPNAFDRNAISEDDGSESMELDAIPA